MEPPARAQHVRQLRFVRNFEHFRVALREGMANSCVLFAVRLIVQASL